VWHNENLSHGTSTIEIESNDTTMMIRLEIEEIKWWVLCEYVDKKSVW
jgi:hypothetical protein